jgi:hypothetical protein
MKDRFLRLQISDSRLNPFNCKFVANCHGYFPIALDLFVEFNALIAHKTPFELRTGATLIGRLILRRFGRKIVQSGCGLCSGILTGPTIKR